MGDLYLEKIREFVFRRSRLHFEGHKKRMLRQRLELRLQQLGLTGYRDYWERLFSDPAEGSRLLDLLTTNETSFFRNPQQFRHLREVLLPRLELHRGQQAWRSFGRTGQGGAQGGMKLRILCAGCATGEEPYSVAMTCLEALRYPKSWDLQIVAGDLSHRCLATARTGYYQADRLKGIPPLLRDKYLTPQDGGAVVSEELRRIVSFHHLNIAELIEGATPPGCQAASAGFDIVFCRNVMIYFSPACQQLLVDALHRLLAPGGYLLTGDAEPLHLFNHDFLAVPDAGCLIYQKTEKAADALAMS